MKHSSPSTLGRCVSIIFNPVSGKQDPESRQRIISEALATHGYTCQFLTTSKEVGAKEVAAKAVQDGVDLVVVSGGDGTVMEALSALVGTSIPVAVLPAGTGNLLSINLGIPTTVPEAIEVALSGEKQRIDLAKTNTGRYFAIMGGMGMDAHLIHDADRETKDRLGVFAYVKTAVQNMSRSRTPLSIHLDGEMPIIRKAKTVLIANMGKVTGGIQAVPTADPTDGMLDVTVITVRRFWHWVRLLWYAARGKTQEDPLVEVFKVKKVNILATRKELVQFDGENGGAVNNLTVEIVPQAVTLLLPKKGSNV